MAEHNVYFAEDYGGDFEPSIANNTTSADIVVEPPVVGEGFGEIVLGYNPMDIKLDHVFSTTEVSVFRAIVGGVRDTSEKHRALRAVAYQMKKLADDPTLVTRMRNNTTFISRDSCD